jgi:hypothetical protein
MASNKFAGLFREVKNYITTTVIEYVRLWFSKLKLGMSAFVQYLGTGTNLHVIRWRELPEDVGIFQNGHVLFVILFHSRNVCCSAKPEFPVGFGQII